MNSTSPPENLTEQGQKTSWYTSRLGWKLAGLVFLGILVIETLILWPSYLNHRESLIAQTASLGRAGKGALISMIQEGEPDSVLLHAGNYLLADPDVVGGAICGSDHKCSVQFGEEVGHSLSEHDEDGDFYHEHESRMETISSIRTVDGIYRVVLIMDTTAVEEEARSYIVRVAGLVALISAVITGIVMISVNRVVLKPLMTLKDRFEEATGGDSHYEDLVIVHRRNDEIGDVLDDFNLMITEKARQESWRQQVEEETKWLARFPAENPSPVIRVSLEGNILYANRAAERIVSTITKPANRKTLQEALNHAFGSEKIITLKQTVLNKTYALLMVPIVGEGYINIYGSDVTGFEKSQRELAEAKDKLEQRVAERTEDVLTARQRLLDAIEVIDDGFAYFGPDEKLILFNSKFQNLYGRTNKVVREGSTLEEIIQYGLSTGLFPQSEENEESWLQARLEKHRNPTGEPLFLATSDGNTYRVQDFPSKEGGVVLIRTDITDFVEQTNELAKAKQKAEDASRAKSDFLATMSHEIRTPMNGVMGMANLLLDSRLDPQQKAMTRTILDSANSLLSVINDILDFSKIEAGQMELEDTEFRLSETIEGVVDLLQSRARDKGLLIGSYLDPALPRKFKGDEGRLRQVIVNLVVNGVKFTDRGVVNIETTVVDVSGDKTRIRITVTDTGPGIPEDQFDSLFEDFTQLDPSKTRQHEGTGLGLAICRRLLTLMGGEIGVESTVGEGSAFWIELPLLALEGPRSLDDAATPSLTVLLATGDSRTDSNLSRQITAWGSRTEILGETSQNSDQVPNGFDVILVDGESLGDRANARRFARAQAHGAYVVVLSGGPFQSDYINPDKILLRPIRHSDLLDALLSIQKTKRFGKGMIPLETKRSDNASLWESAAGIPSSRILIVEDNPVNQQVIQMMLEKMGHRVDVAGNGAEAVAIARQAPYDLVFMDVHMPDQDGLSATRELRELKGRFEKLPIIALTANVEADVQRQCLDAGMDDYVSKPVRVQALVDVIRKHVLTESYPQPSA